MRFEEKKLGDLLDNKGYIRGPFGSSLKRGDMMQKGHPVYEQQHAIYNHRKFRYFISEEKLNKLFRFKVKNNDLIISCSGTLGKISIIKTTDPKGIISQALLIIRANSNVILPIYLYYFLISKKGQQELLNASHGAVQQNIAPRNVVEKISIPLPDKTVQQKITSILKSLDKKIELNNQINQTLEEMAQALFKSWFVDFDPVRAKMRGEQPVGMDAETAALFPDKLVDSELGAIPEGWGVYNSSEISNISIGKTPPRKETKWFKTENNKFTVKWVSIKDMGKANVYLNNTSEYLTKDAIKKFNVKTVPENTVILSFKLTVGRVAITDELLVTNEAIAQFDIIDKSLISTEYLYLYMKNFNFDSMGSTSSIARAINSKVIKEVPIILPTQDLNKYFSKYISKKFNLLNTLNKQNQTLTQIRDTLLPKLLSGEIKLK